MITIITILGMSLADRARGGLLPKPWYHLGTIGMGYLIAWNCGYPAHWSTIACIILFWLGEAPGWGYPLGNILNGKRGPIQGAEWWQYGFLKHHDWPSVIVRGAIWVIPVALLAIYDIAYLKVLWMIVAFPLSLLLMRKPAVQSKNDRWPLVEWVRGAMFGALILI